MEKRVIKRYFLALALILAFGHPHLQAREFTEISIPGAKCGNGAQYKVFYAKKDPALLAVEMMGGGACWSASSCFGPGLRTWIYPIPKLPAYSFMSMDSQRGPLNNHSLLYFPYCTGDVHAGDHQASYERGKVVYHHGYRNIVLALAFLAQEKIISFEQVKKFVLYGSSAGGIGAFIHSKNFDDYLPLNVQKTLLSDSPGLHFGKNFWKKFTPSLLRDFHTAFDKINFHFSDDDGLVAHHIPDVCEELWDWQIGVLQSTEDIIMTVVFGDQTFKKHRELILGQNGLLASTREGRNCAAWVNDSKIHTFLLLGPTIRMKAGGISALDFSRRVMAGQTQKNYSL